MSDLLEERDLIKRHNDGLHIAGNKYKVDKNLKTIRRIADDALRKYSVVVNFLTSEVRKTNILDLDFQR